MTARSGWTYDGKHFTETRAVNGGLRYFIDGKPVSRLVFVGEMAEARKSENERVDLPRL